MAASLVKIQNSNHFCNARKTTDSLEGVSEKLIRDRYSLYIFCSFDDQGLFPELSNE